MPDQQLSLQEQFGHLTAAEIWTDPDQRSAIRLDSVVVIPGDPSTTTRGFSAALLVLSGHVGDSKQPVTDVVACSEKQLLDLADEIQRRLRPDKLDRILDALEDD